MTNGTSGLVIRWTTPGRIAAALASVALVGCGGGDAPVEGDAPRQSISYAEEPAPLAQAPFGIGDVEANTLIEVNIPAEARGGSIAVAELRNPKKELSLATVAVSEPYPAVLPVSVTLDPSGQFEGRLVAVRGVVKRDETEIDSFQTFIGVAADPATWPLAFGTNALEGLDTPPDSMLISAEATLMLLPPDTAIESVDLETVTVSGANRSVKIGNPMRVNFGE